VSYGSSYRFSITLGGIAIARCGFGPPGDPPRSHDWLRRYWSRDCLFDRGGELGTRARRCWAAGNVWNRSAFQ